MQLSGQYSTPVNSIGGRFNIGNDLDRARGQAFPCLYVAHDIDTAYREYFGGPLTDRAGKLTLGEFALRRPTSFTTFSLRGSLDQVFDLRNRGGLPQFAKIIAKFDVSTDTKAFARKAGLQQRQLLTTSHQLWKRLLIGPAEWRAEPQMSGIPAASQIFGRFIRDAGFDAHCKPGPPSHNPGAPNLNSAHSWHNGTSPQQLR